MSYRRPGLGQAKWVPGQVAFMTTPTGRLPNVQRLVEAGLPIAPYIEHGSWVTGEPDIMRYGRDPYRGIMGLGTDPSEVTDQIIRSGSETVQDTIRQTAEAIRMPVAFIGTGVAAGGIVGALSGFFGKTILGGILGAVGGGAIGYAAYKLVAPSSEGSAP